MLDTPSDHVEVSAVMLKQASSHPWGSDLWSLLGLIPGLSQTALSQAQDKGDIHYLPSLKIQLYPQHCESYYQNLISGQAQVYMVCPQSDEAPQPLLITVDYDEAASYMETGEQIFNAALPEELCLWLERFVLAHYQPEKPKKRRRKKWHVNEVKS
ncbi:hypothetical protein A9Q79_05605 [Methylophaga sp. 42_25_T18]|nr:hypothetical protein A9Q79_05605 [Methylophaga sp. 42_25_T18]OUR88365.1 hypothetical protein A9Q92_02995 [Methylophaga sp. 42_8_T64]